MLTITFASRHITKSKINKINKINTHGVINHSIRNSLCSNKVVLHNQLLLNITKYTYCTKQQTKITNFDSIFNEAKIDKYPWTFQLIGAGTGIAAYSVVITLNYYLAGNSLVNIIAQIGCIYSFGHLIGLTNTNFRDFLNQTFLATGALIVMILIFAFCYALINSGNEYSKDEKELNISVVTNKE